MRRKTILVCLLICVLAFAMSTTSFADADMRRAVLGADLSEEQIATVYSIFGMARGSVPELKVTNAEERRYLEGYVSDNIIGTLSISSVYVELLAPGSGMDVKTTNVSWCTAEMYISALATAGITDARILVAAPFSVSGTAALTGVYKAYEDMTGEQLDDAAKQVSTQELTVTGDLANVIGSEDSTSIVGELKDSLGDTSQMTDEQLRAQIIAIAANYSVSLSDQQIQQLIDLCRSLEVLNIDSLQSRMEEMQGTLNKVSDAKNQVVGFWGTLKNAAESVMNFFDQLSAFFSKN